ncbi:hypothetical protein ACFV0T_10540 [Streptomyces sp. NPDC059582]|uniref:hypothetical protein n=1 Tax=Streptomyces sp. NPDC059582 TaxID=3346875 RepID=UPI0036C57CD7
MLKALAEASGKVIGGARFSLTSVLPGVLLATIVAAVARAGLFDLEARPDFTAVAPGRQDTAAVVLFVFFAFVVGVLLRPFEAAIVQLLEGYWERPSPLAPLRDAAIERHRRRRDRALLMCQHSEAVEEADRTASSSPGSRAPGASVSLHELAERDRRRARLRRNAKRARSVRAGYATEIRQDSAAQQRDPHGELMPTSLGNMLLRAERLSGDRYGLDMMRVYPRIYPFIAPRLENAVTQQLSLIAATASLAVSLGVTTLALLPLVLRWDIWSLLPLAPAVLTALAYRGATAAAAFHGTLLSAVFDVHHFDLAKAFHYDPPESAEELTAMNQQISEFLAQDKHAYVEELGHLSMTHQPESEDPLQRANGNGASQT